MRVVPFPTMDVKRFSASSSNPKRAIGTRVRQLNDQAVSMLKIAGMVEEEKGVPFAQRWSNFQHGRAFWPAVIAVGALVVGGAAAGIAVGVVSTQHHGLTPAEQVVLFGLSPR